MFAGITQSVLWLATGWTFRESNPGGGEIFRTHPDRPWGPPSLLYHGYRVFLPGVKRPGDGFDHPSLSSAKVTERTELYPCFPSGFSWPILRWPLLLYFTDQFFFAEFQKFFYFLLNWMFVEHMFIKSEGSFWFEWLRTEVWQDNGAGGNLLKSWRTTNCNFAITTLYDVKHLYRIVSLRRGGEMYRKHCRGSCFTKGSSSRTYLPILRLSSYLELIWYFIITCLDLIWLWRPQVITSSCADSFFRKYDHAIIPFRQDSLTACRGPRTADRYRSANWCSPALRFVWKIVFVLSRLAQDEVTVFFETEVH